MGKTVTFSFSSNEFIGTAATESFTFAELGIDETLEGAALKGELDRVFQAWVSHKLNLSISMVWKNS